MSRLRLLLPFLAAIALAAGCGGGFKDDYAPVDTQLHDVGQQLVTALNGASHQTNGQFASTIRAVERNLSDVQSKLARLTPTDDVKADYAALRKGLAKVDADLNKLAGVVNANDVASTKATVKSLLTDAAAVTPHVRRIRKTLGLPTPK
jgi:hypothetical protein